MKSRRFVVLGGAGTIGRIVVQDLFHFHPANQILIADYNLIKAHELAASFKDKRVKACLADVKARNHLRRLLFGYDVVINCTQHHFNLIVMEAALGARVHYVDLGGLFKWTRKQLKLGEEFRSAGLTAVIGMGCAPGITNVLAAYAANRLGKIRSIKIRVGSRDLDASDALNFCFPYSAQTIVEELTLRPWIFRNGKFEKISPRTGWELTPFPKPVGKTWTLWTRHSEVATLPLSLCLGVRYCDFKVSFEPEFVRHVMALKRSGLTMKDFSAMVSGPTQPNDYEIARVIADDLVVDCHSRPNLKWGAGAGDINTGCPSSIVAQMIIEGAIGIGVLPPELAVPVKPFFRELEKRGMKIKISKNPVR